MITIDFEFALFLTHERTFHLPCRGSTAFWASGRLYWPIVMPARP